MKAIDQLQVDIVTASLNRDARFNSSVENGQRVLSEILTLMTKSSAYRRALENAHRHISSNSMASSSRTEFLCYHCFNCDEFMDEAVWPEHGNPNCGTKKILDEIEAELGPEVTAKLRAEALGDGIPPKPEPIPDNG